MLGAYLEMARGNADRLGKGSARRGEGGDQAGHAGGGGQGHRLRVQLLCDEVPADGIVDLNLDQTSNDPVDIQRTVSSSTTRRSRSRSRTSVSWASASPIQVPSAKTCTNVKWTVNNWVGTQVQTIIATSTREGVLTDTTGTLSNAFEFTDGYVDAMGDFLAGNARPVLQRLEREMDEASGREEFEQAVLGLLGKRLPVQTIGRGGWEDVRSLVRAQQTDTRSSRFDRAQIAAEFVRI